MKRLLLIALLAIVSSAPALAQSGTERKVLKLYKEYEEAIARRDASVHERLFADDYTYTPGNGNFMGRTEHMKFTKSGAVVVQSLRSEDVRVRVYGNTAVVTGLWVSADRRRDKEFAERRIRYMLVFVRRGGRWQIVAEQRTGVAAESR
ncbi:MAG: nuclear transport factor 2 family protein [Acidobacteria bacterium]|nr:nuclear transport factor 2 family protein [Acidobacteriota bacterium]